MPPAVPRSREHAHRRADARTRRAACVTSTFEPHSSTTTEASGRFAAMVPASSRMPPSLGREGSERGQRVEESLAGRGRHRPALHLEVDLTGVTHRAQAQGAGGGDGELELVGMAVVRRVARQAEHEVRPARLLVLAHHDAAGARRRPPVDVAQVVAGLVLAQGVERHVVGREIVCRRAPRGRGRSRATGPRRRTVRGCTYRSTGSSRRWTRSSRPSGSPRTTLTGPTASTPRLLVGMAKSSSTTPPRREAADREHAAARRRRAAPHARGGWLGCSSSRASARRRLVRPPRRGCA